VTLFRLAQLIPRTAASAIALILGPECTSQLAEELPATRRFEGVSLKSPSHHRVKKNCAAGGASIIPRAPTRRAAKFASAALRGEDCAAFPARLVTHRRSRRCITLSDTLREPGIDLVLEKGDAANADSHRFWKSPSGNLTPHRRDRNWDLSENFRLREQPSSFRGLGGGILRFGHKGPLPECGPFR
jgi:hypothetical protein